MVTKVSSSVLDTNAVFAAGTKLCFYQASAPTGWTQITDDSANNRTFRVVTGSGGGLGGTHSPILMNVVPSHTHTITTGTESAGHTHTVSGTTASDGSHTHTITDPGHTHTITDSPLYNIGYDGPLDGAGSDHASSQDGVITTRTTTSSTVGISINSGGAHTHTFSATTGSTSATHTHSGTTDNGSSSTNWQPRYIDMILCSKN